MLQISFHLSEKKIVCHKKGGLMIGSVLTRNRVIQLQEVMTSGWS